MADIEERLRLAMHAATDGTEASPDELIRLVVRRRRGHARQTGMLILAILALAVPAAIALLSPLHSGGQPPANRTTPPPKLPARLSGLPMPAGTNFEMLMTTSRGLAWYSTATRRTEPIADLPPLSGGYQVARLDGGWAAWPASFSEPCPYNLCAGTPTTYYFVADGSMKATRIGLGYRGDGIDPGSNAGTAWLVNYPRSTTKLTASSYAQMVSTAGTALGPRYRMPASFLMGRGIGGDLLLVVNTNQSEFELWDPATGQVVRHFDNVVAQGPEQIVWTNGCANCTLQVTNVATGKTISTRLPGSQSANLNAALSDDGQLLAVQLPGGGVAVLNTGTGSVIRIPGTAVSTADFEDLDWQNGGHRLVIRSGSQYAAGPDQIAYWQPGDPRIYVATISNLQELPEIETGALG